MLQNATLIYAERLPAQGTSKLLIRVRQGERVLEMVGEGMGELVNELQLGSTVHVCFTAEVKYANGIPTLDLQIVDIAPANSDRIVLRHK
jgi:hypothetical protein